ncbi:uncharacterized protein LOC125421362 [Ziziphus jujuba]|uniref:Uncharacterized protein LOC125421362 n=1 Tax=Ziziphus jujuba TaxID=326968 RepID=A0ABM3IDC6_ZIZJJ|nr:uncharacterized protein LOC125421362 [Ziziphus jujuba]
MAVSISTNLTQLLFFTILLILVSSSSARLFPDTVPALNLVLPGENHVVAGLSSSSSEKDMGRKVALPCNMETYGKQGMGFQPLRLGGRKHYGSLVLNMLPKGPVPSSGPSKRINGNKN